MTIKDAKEIGREHGAGFVKCNPEWRDMPEDKMWEHVNDVQEHFRQFSPFEFTAKEFNESRNPDATWEAYDNGIMLGVRAALKGKS